jgi:hypothetical protein
MNMSPAAQLIQHLRESVLCVDAEWAINRDGGFSWWPHQQRQDIFVDRKRSEADGTKLERVVVSTEIGNLVQAGHITHRLVTGLTRLATLSGIVCENGHMRLHSHAWVEKSNQPLYDMVLGLVAGMQAHEAALIAAQLQEAGLGEPLLTPHPITGLRDEPDDIALVMNTVIKPAGPKESPWPSEIFDELREQYFSGPPCLWANSDTKGITAEFPFGTESSLLQANKEHTHPVVGKGIWVLNSFNLEHVTDASCHNPLALNSWEIEQANYPFFGSWCAPADGRVDFVTFVPNALKHPAAAANCILLGIGRARFVSFKWLGDDWSKTWDENGNCKAKPAMERAMENLES